MTSVIDAKEKQGILDGHFEESWPEQLRAAYTSVDAMRQDGFELPMHVPAYSQAQHLNFNFRVPRSYAALFDQNDLSSCPLFRQALPSELEIDPILPRWAQTLSQRATGRDCPWSADAIGDVAHLGASRLTHRYHRRAILHTTLACALYCRFCFRKSHMADQEQSLYHGSFAPALGYLEEHPEIDEVILTGGDPLSLSDLFLGRLIEKIRDLKTVKTLRLHTRLPGVLPARLTKQLAKTLREAAGPMHLALVAHINHDRELTDATRRGLEQLRAQGVTLLHQAVLLRGVNDSVETLETLFQTLYHWGCLPFYLHHPDWTPNTFGFRVTISQGRRLMAALAGRVSGPALPRYVLDVPGGAGKISLTDERCRPLEGREDSGSDNLMTGQLWHVPYAHTRSTRSDNSGLYLDLAPVPPSI